MYLQKLKSIKSRRHVRRSFDTLIAKDDNPSNKSQTLFFGIPKGTFCKKSPLESRKTMFLIMYRFAEL